MIEENLEGIEMPSSNKARFLNVLFVLSTIYIIFNLYSALHNSLWSDTAIKNIEDSITQIQYSELGKMKLAVPFEEYMNNYLSYYTLNNLLGMIVLLIDALGLYLMFKRRRVGYWVYTCSNVVLLIGTIALSVWPNLFSIFLLFFTILFFGVFQLLYGLNLKHLKG